MESLQLGIGGCLLEGRDGVGPAHPPTIEWHLKVSTDLDEQQYWSEGIENGGNVASTHAWQSNLPFMLVYGRRFSLIVYFKTEPTKFLSHVM